jgi:hypothetical protein
MFKIEGLVIIAELDLVASERRRTPSSCHRRPTVVPLA